MLYLCPQPLRHLKNLQARLFLCICALCATMFFAQDCAAQAKPDTSLNNIIGDTVRRKKPEPGAIKITSAASDTVRRGPFQPNPKKAGLYSALLPGLGQVYNRQYWKVPIVYAGLGTAVYYYIQNRNSYLDYRKAYIGRLIAQVNGTKPTDRYVTTYSTDQLKPLQDDFNRYMNISALLGGLGMALQIMDAVTSAHLRNFDISRDISLRMVPMPMPGGVGVGLAANYTIR
jgi:hypothetical protein